MKRILYTALALALLGINSPAEADPDKDESGHGRYYDRRGRDGGGDHSGKYVYKEEYKDGKYKIEQKWEGKGGYKEEYKYEGTRYGDRHDGRNHPPPRSQGPAVEIRPVVVAPARSGPPPHAPAHGYRAKNRYHYYPKEEVYYDPGLKVYFYRDGSRWRKVTTLPRRIRLATSFVTIDIGHDRPYQEFENHRTSYPRGYDDRGHQYHYYPREQVYFDPGRRIYFYKEGATWRNAATLPKHMQFSKSDYVPVKSNFDKPYQDFDSHRTKYPPQTSTKMGEKSPEPSSQERQAPAKKGFF